ncbi:pyridoxal phosphate homeostasis protein [Cylas formicarius]|uniref:pyridoxal phosphate homeostasis protein n=1 Tax=Cylas formicarius TaxID=197179 RepID=UPI002958565D|nr:pyridoxal phosphate homeostasis protein [Cylas formicarius]
MSDLYVAQNLQMVLNRIRAACGKRAPNLPDIQPRLVAASKTKPVECIVAAYNEGQRHFGENYVQELEDKANDKEILEKCTEIKWHFIGHLQSNKAKQVLSVPNIYVIETVDSAKLASLLDRNWVTEAKPKLKVMIQVNTSGEDVKSGIAPMEVPNLAKHILQNCPNLQFDGLMTIGRLGYNPDGDPNPDFVKLRECRENVCEELNLELKDLNLSMGMSDDFERAIEQGSTNVRVGTSIFGQRQQKA